MTCIPNHPASLSNDMLLTQCTVQRTRASGPGGQHRNKVQTAIVLIHHPTGIRAQACERRQQEQNKKMALFRLRINLAIQVRTPPPAKPSDCWRQRCRHGVIQINPQHTDFPTLLAEAMDFLADCDFDPCQAANRLECSVSQLVKLLKIHAAAIVYVNKQRADRSLHALR